MTPTELEDYVRQRYNAVGDTFYTQPEIFNHFWAGQMELAQKTFCIRDTQTDTTVADQRAYDFPTNCLSIRRLEIDGKRIYPNDFLDDDSLTGNNTDQISGVPVNYQVWGDQFYLRPTPSENGLTITIYTYELPVQPTSSGVLSVPERYHLYLADYALYCMLSKDKNYQMATYFFDLWKEHLKTALQTERLRMSGDSFAVVKDMDELDISAGPF